MSYKYIQVTNLIADEKTRAREFGNLIPHDSCPIHDASCPSTIAHHL